MTPLKQLFRQPVRLFAIFLLVGMASAFICLSAGVFSSAKATLAQIEERYVTIGIPTTETEGVTTEYNGLTLHHEESIISQDMWAYMDQLAADGRIIKGAYQQKYISAYCPSIPVSYTHLDVYKRQYATRRLSSLPTHWGTKSSGNGESEEGFL